jgi:hypothetical protein
MKPLTYQAPQVPVTDGFSWAFYGATVSGQTNAGGVTVVTLSGIANGFQFMAGQTMAVHSGGTGTIPGGIATITAISGSWPWATIELTLNVEVTGTLNLVDIVMPNLATVVAGSIVGNTIQHGLPTPTGFPLYMANVAANNVHDDGPGAWDIVSPSSPVGGGQASPLVVCNEGYGNRFGDGVSVQIVGMTTQTAVLQGDLTMRMSVDGESHIEPYGTGGVFSRPFGVAVQAAGAFTYRYVDVQNRCDSNFPALFNNKSGATIPAGALVYADPANPGGLTSTIPTTTGCWTAPVGRNGATAITTGTSGYLAELWL